MSKDSAWTFIRGEHVWIARGVFSTSVQADYQWGGLWMDCMFKVADLPEGFTASNTVAIVNCAIFKGLVHGYVWSTYVTADAVNQTKMAEAQSLPINVTLIRVVA